MIIIGIDPDSRAHGVAVYYDGKLKDLFSLNIVEFISFIDSFSLTSKEIEIHVENVCGMSAVFRQRQGGSGGVNMKMANSVGRCQQAQIELERVIKCRGIKIVNHKISKMWKKDRAQFEKVTGWKGRSNEDTRSAAYFGYLGAKQ